MQLAGDKLVEGVEVAVRPKLGGQIANGQSARTASGEQVIAGEIYHRVLLVEYAIATRQYPAHQCHDIIFWNDSPQSGTQYLVVDGREMLDYIKPQGIAVALAELPQPGYRLMGAFSHPVGIAVGGEQPLEAWLNDVA